MSKFDFNKLVVLHLYNYIKPTGEQDPLSNIERTCNAVKVSTCMRIILIIHSDSLISNEQKAAYNSLTNFLDKKDVYSANTFFERLDGTKAYQFLLYWMIGGINPKRIFDDTRILGDVREIWNKTLKSPSLRLKTLVSIYSSFFHAFFTDSALLGKLISVYNENDKPDKLKMACVNCAWAREKGFLALFSTFDYQTFAENTHLSHLENGLESMKEKILKKVTFSSTGTELTFFKSKYEVSEEKLDGVSNRIKKIIALLEFLNSLKKDGLENIDPNIVEPGMVKLPDTNKTDELELESDLDEGFGTKYSAFF
jgi:hypothetical protein